MAKTGVIGKTFPQIAVSVALLGIPVPPIFGSEFGELARALDTPRVGRAIELQEPIDLGRGKLTAAADTIVYPLIAAGEICGVWVAGKAVFEYRVTDHLSIPVAARNVRRSAGVAVERTPSELIVREEVKSAVVWGWSLIEVPPDAERESAGGAPEFSPWAGEVLTAPFFPLPSTELLAARLNADSSLRYALFEVPGRDLRLLVDPGSGQLEQLWSLRRLGPNYLADKGRYLNYELASQPIGRRWWEPAAVRAKAIRQVIEVNNTEDADVVVRSVTTVQALVDGVGVWRVNLADRTIDHRNRIRPVRVQAVAVGGQPTSYAHSGNDLLVEIPQPLLTGQAAEIEVIHGGALAVRPLQQSFWRLDSDRLVPDPGLGARAAAYDIRVRVPKPFVPFASGRELSRSEDGDYNTLHTVLDGQLSHPTVVAGDYKIVEAERDGYRVRVASHVFEQREAAAILQNMVLNAAQYFGQVFDFPYPFQELNLVEIDSWGFGQAPAGVIYLTKEAFAPISVAFTGLPSLGIPSLSLPPWRRDVPLPVGLGSKHVNGTIVHEVAHGWWGHVVQWPSPEEQWLSESFAEYSAALGLRALKGGRAGEREFQRKLKEWRGQTKRLGKGTSIYLANRLAGEDTQDVVDRAILLYSKGPLVLHALRTKLQQDLGGKDAGDRHFMALWRTLMKSFPYQPGETRHLIGILNQITNQDWFPWFEKYVFGFETPVVSQ